MAESTGTTKSPEMRGYIEKTKGRKEKKEIQKGVELQHLKRNKPKIEKGQSEKKTRTRKVEKKIIEEKQIPTTGVELTPLRKSKPQEKKYIPKVQTKEKKVIQKENKKIEKRIKNRTEKENIKGVEISY